MMKRWLVSTAMMALLAVPLTARAQVSRTDTAVVTDTLISKRTVSPTYMVDTTRRDTISAGYSAGQYQRDTTYFTSRPDTMRRDTTIYGVTRSDTTYITQSHRDTTYVSTAYREENDHSAQEQAGFMIKGGWSFGNVSNRGVLPGDLSGRNGWALGLGFHGVSPVGFGIEGLWVQRGLNNAGLPIGDINARELDYIDVPAYLRLSVPFAVQPFLYAGPQASFEIRCRSGAVDCPDTGRPTTSWSAIIGAGVRLGLGLAVSVEGRYVYGLTDLHLSTITTSSSYRTRSFMILAGIGI
jgi:hypothetical protein